MLGGILPLNMKNLSSAMLRVAAAFCNFMPPLAKKFKWNVSVDFLGVPVIF